MKRMARITPYWIHPRHLRNPRFYLSLILLAVAGCSGGDTVRVTGQLLKDGKPYTANLAGKEPETFGVDLVGTINERKYLFSASMSSDGSFRVDGPDGRGIPKGQYRITVLHSGFEGRG